MKTLSQTQLSQVSGGFWWGAATQAATTCACECGPDLMAKLFLFGVAVGVYITREHAPTQQPLPLTPPTFEQR